MGATSATSAPQRPRTSPARPVRGRHGCDRRHRRERRARAPGTQLSLGLGAPDDETCEADGDIYIDTEVVQFYECTERQWTLFGPVPTAEGATPDADTEDPGAARRASALAAIRGELLAPVRAGTRSAGPGTDWLAGWLSGGASRGPCAQSPVR